MRHVGADRQRYGHAYFGAGYWLVLPYFAVAVPALDRGTAAHFEYRVVGRFARIHFCGGSESSLRSGGLPAGAQFRQHLADPEVSDQVADSFSRFYLLAVCPMCLLRHHLSRWNAGGWSPGGNSTATVENTLGNGRDRFGGRRIFVCLFAHHASGFGIFIVLEFAIL